MSIEWVELDAMNWDFMYRWREYGFVVRNGRVVAPVAGALHLWNSHYVYGPTPAWAQVPLILNDDGTAMTFQQYLSEVVKPLQDKYLDEHPGEVLL